MRLKPLPSPPEEVEAVAEARRAIPLVPGSEMDCCARIMDRLGIDEREEARKWLTLLRAIGLVAETDEGYARTRRVFDPDAAAGAFVENVFAACETLDALEETEPRTPAAIFERVEATVPNWERDKYRGRWREVWQERTADLLGWLVLFGLAARREDGYVLGDRARSLPR